MFEVRELDFDTGLARTILRTDFWTEAHDMIETLREMRTDGSRIVHGLRKAR
jgi:hypothetical protein